jgi:hypothetical protein
MCRVASAESVVLNKTLISCRKRPSKSIPAIPESDDFDRGAILWRLGFSLIRALEPNDQEQLLRALFEELDGAADPDVDRSWLDEAQRRSHELDSRAVEEIPFHEVIAKRGPT